MTRWLPRLGFVSPEGPQADGFDLSHLATGIGKRTAYSATVTLASSAFIFGLQIAQLAILSRLLSPEDFGLVGMAMVAAGFVSLFADFGLATATVQRDRIDQHFVSALFYIDLLVSLGLMLLCFAIAPFTAQMFSEPRITMIIVAIGLTFPLLALRGQHQALLARRMLYVRINFTNVASNALGATAAIICAWSLELGYWSIVAGIVANTVSQVVLSWVVSPWLPSRPGSLAAGKTALGFGLNLLASNLAGWMWKQGDRAIIGWRWDATELGYYTRAYSVLMVPLQLVSGPLGSAVIPALSRLQKDKPKWTRLMMTSARMMAFFAGLLTLCLALNAEFIIRLLLGPDWSKSATIFSLLALSIYPAFIWEHARFVFISLGRTDIMRNYSVAAALVHFAAFAAGVAWGGVGVASSLAVASLVVTPVLLIVSARVADCTVRDLTAQFAPSFAALLAIAAIAYFSMPLWNETATWAESFVKTAAIVVAYCTAHLLLLPFSKAWSEDFVWLTDIVKSSHAIRPRR